MIGFDDIDFPEYPVFSGKYRLTGSNREAVAAFFTPRAVSFFEQLRGWSAQGSGGFIILYRTPLVKPENYQSFMEEARGIFQILTGK